MWYYGRVMWQIRDHLKMFKLLCFTWVSCGFFVCKIFVGTANLSCGNVWFVLVQFMYFYHGFFYQLAGGP
jgi:hypothetical protein